MEQSRETIPDLAYVNGINYPPDSYEGKLNLTIPPNTHTELLLDNRVLTMGYPQLSVSGGACSIIKITSSLISLSGLLTPSTPIF